MLETSLLIKGKRAKPLLGSAVFAIVLALMTNRQQYSDISLLTQFILDNKYSFVAMIGRDTKLIK